jgi:N-acetylated-alpha-linked acidic dipeptidase
VKGRLIALACAALLLTTVPPARADQSASEQTALQVPNASSVMQVLYRLNQESHYASTPGDYHIATWLRDEFTRDGFNASLETFKHDVPFQQRLTLQLVFGPKKALTLPLNEVPIASDPDGTREGAGTPFNAWSGSGQAFANLVDAGHGMPDDYRALAAHGVDVRTRILLIRYGREFRGNLALRAQQNGARGVIFFNDPADRGGALRGPAYPDGPYRPTGSTERGALLEGQITIPTLPVTYVTAQQLLAHIKDGISDVPVRMTVEMRTSHNATLWNTVGVMPGKDPTHMVVIGAHRDAWVYGVTDNGSGIAVIVQTARALQYLYASGWRPQFTIVLVGFDGEEIGEVGSKEFVRAHRAILEAGCVAYVNQDESATGTEFHASGAAALERLMTTAAAKVQEPNQPRPLLSLWGQQQGGAGIGGPGGGSDFEPFLYDAGIPTLEYGFSGPFGVYHSGFDDLNFVMKWADPGMAYHRTLGQLTALLAITLADGAIPYQLSPYAPRMSAALATIGSHGDLSPIVAAISRFSRAAQSADTRGMDGNAEIAVVHRLNKLFYGRNGYAAVAFPDVSAAIASGNPAAVSAAAGRTAHELDSIDAAIAAALRR